MIKFELTPQEQKNWNEHRNRIYPTNMNRKEYNKIYYSTEKIPRKSKKN